MFTLKGMVHLTQDMASNDDFGPPEQSDDGQTAVLCKKHADFTLLVCKIYSRPRGSIFATETGIIVIQQNCTTI